MKNNWKYFNDIDKNTTVSLYKSSDIELTAKYFDKESDTSEFFVLVFKYNYKRNSDVYIKYPSELYFTELQGHAFSSRGDMCYGSRKNTYDKWKDIRLKFHKTDMLIEMGTDFNFLKKIAEKNFEDTSKIMNSQLINSVLETQYLSLPEDIFDIAYSYQLENKNIYLICYVPTYNFSYDNHKFVLIENNKITELQLKSFERLRDGGTTQAELIDDDNKKYEFYSPMSYKNQLPHLNDNKLIKIKSDKLNLLIDILGIKIHTDEN